MRPMPIRRGDLAFRALPFLLALGCIPAFAGEPDPKTYWDVKDIRPGMKGIGQDRDGRDEARGVRGRGPGRDDGRQPRPRHGPLPPDRAATSSMPGIIQGMSGSPIYIDGKLLGAVAFAWEFAKDPIAGVTPFQQMVQYVRSNDRRIAAEAKDRGEGRAGPAAAGPSTAGPDRRPGDRRARLDAAARSPVSGGGLAGMRPIATPLAASGFSPRALALLDERFRPLGLAPMAGGGGARSGSSARRGTSRSSRAPR